MAHLTLLVFFAASFEKIIKKAENNTNILFADVYKSMATQARLPVGDFFINLHKYLQQEEVDLRDSVNDFFDHLFPLVFHHTINPKLAPFSRDYTECLVQVRQEIRPFGEAPHKLIADLQRSFQVARMAMQALEAGIEVLNATENYAVSGDCVHAVMKMKYCPYCAQIVDAIPCQDYCRNVMRGCLTHLVEFDPTWNRYLETLVDLTSRMHGQYNIEEVLLDLDKKTSEGIMHAMENGPELNQEVSLKPQI